MKEKNDIVIVPNKECCIYMQVRGDKGELLAAIKLFNFKANQKNVIKILRAIGFINCKFFKIEYRKPEQGCFLYEIDLWTEQKSLTVCCTYLFDDSQPKSW